MFELSWRRAMFLVTILLASIEPREAGAQDPFALPGDLLLLKARELEVKHDQARIQDDINRGDTAGMNRDLRMIRRHERSVERFRRRVRGDVFIPLAFQPLPPPNSPVPANPTHNAPPQYPGFGYFPSDPDHLYRLPQAPPVANSGTPPDASRIEAPAATADAHVLIEIVNTGAPGATVDYVIDGVAYRLDGGGRHSLTVGPRSKVAFDRGSGLGRWRYSLSAGVYEFRPGNLGWMLYKVSPIGS